MQSPETALSFLTPIGTFHPVVFVAFTTPPFLWLRVSAARHTQDRASDEPKSCIKLWRGKRGAFADTICCSTGYQTGDCGYCNGQDTSQKTPNSRALASSNFSELSFVPSMMRARPAFDRMFKMFNTTPDRPFSLAHKSATSSCSTTSQKHDILLDWRHGGQICLAAEVGEDLSISFATYD
jgi:hypothetical protein